MRTRITWFGVSCVLLALAALLLWRWHWPDQESTPGSTRERSVQPMPIAGQPASAAGTAFTNTCDVDAVGFVGADGRPPRLRIAGAPEGAVLMCRSGAIGKVAELPFTPCDGRDGREHAHVPQLREEGTHRTEIRYVLENRTAELTGLTYYVHRSLDQAACCAPALPDHSWYANAKAVLPPAPAFGTDTHLEKPFIRITADAGGTKVQEDLRSLRRSFQLSEDQALLLIRRTTVSRRGVEKRHAAECVGLRVHVPTIGPDPTTALSCSGRRVRERPYESVRAGRTDSRCPGVFCTLTACRKRNDGCIVVTHTFNRGPGQTPWQVAMPAQCPPRGGLAVLGYTSYDCDAYVLNSRGQAVCMVNEGGTVRSIATIGNGDDALGLKVLDEQRGRAGDRYVFSNKHPRPGIKGALYLSP